MASGMAIAGRPRFDQRKVDHGTQRKRRRQRVSGLEGFGRRPENLVVIAVELFRPAQNEIRRVVKCRPGDQKMQCLVDV